MQLETIIVFILSGLTSVFGNLLLKAGMNEVGFFSFSPEMFFSSILKVTTNIKILLGLTLYALGAVVYLKLLLAYDVTKSYPALVGFMFISLLILGALFLKEPLTVAKISGALIIVLGIFIALK